mgnify:FL=1
MELNDYQTQAMSTRMDSCDNHLYMMLEIASEAGELQGKFAKAIRKGRLKFSDNLINSSVMETREEMDFDLGVILELGDILWGVAGMAASMGYSLEEVARFNLEKLAKRKVNGTIEGNGDGVTREERHA